MNYGTHFVPTGHALTISHHTHIAEQLCGSSIMCLSLSGNWKPTNQPPAPSFLVSQFVRISTWSISLSLSPPPLELGFQTAMSCHVNRTWVLWKSRQCSHCWTAKLSLQPDIAFRYIALPGKHEFQSALCPLNKVVGNSVYLSFLFYLLFCGFFFSFDRVSLNLEHVLELVLVDQAGSLKLCLLNAGNKEACI